MTRHHTLLFVLLFGLFTSSSAICNGLEFKITVSGKLLLGIAYRHQIDANTAIRLGAHMGVGGAPVGFQASIAQDLAPASQWTPAFGVGMEAILFKKGESFSWSLFPSATGGVSYCPQPTVRHSSEIWIGWLDRKPVPMGLSYIYLTTLY